MKLTPIKNNILFKFIDKMDINGQFIEETSWGLVISGHFDTSAKQPRWVEVIEVGPECKDVKVGQQALVGALRWTPHFIANESKMWKTDEDQIFVLRDTPDSELIPLRDTIVFTRIDEQVKPGLELVIVGDSEQTPKGEINIVGPNVSEELPVGTVFYFDGISFFEKFSHKKEMLCFIKQDDVLIYQEAA